MLMGLTDVLARAKTTEEREEIRRNFLRMRDLRRKLKDEDIDFSDIPEVTDFSGFVPCKPYIDRIREHNKRVWAERERAKQEHQNLTKQPEGI